MKIVRVQLDFPSDRVNELDQLMKEAKLSTRKELFNNALTLFQWAVSERKKGKAIGSIDESRNILQKLLMPAIQAVKQDPAPEPVVYEEYEDSSEVVAAVTGGG